MDNWKTETPPKHTVLIADFGTYTDKVIFNGSKYWSETELTFINETPQKWAISKDYEQERENTNNS